MKRLNNMKRILFTILILCFWCGSAWSGYLPIKSTGTRAAGEEATFAATQVTGFWADNANSYPDLATANAQSSASDVFVFYNETHTGIGVDGTVTLQTGVSFINSNNDTGYTDCVVDFSHADQLIQSSKTPGTTTAITGITFQNHPTAAGSTVALFFRANVGATSTWTITSCKFYNNKRESVGAYGSCVSTNWVAGTATLNLVDCVFDTNSNNTYGCVYIDDGLDLSASGCTFTDNIGVNRGATIGVYRNSVIDIDDCTFTGNNFPGAEGTVSFGAAIAIRGGDPANPATLTVTGSTFTSNDAYAGGAIYAQESNVTLTDSSFTSNSATTKQGGAVFLDTEDLAGSIIISGCTFTSNTSLLTGGGLCIYDGDITISGSTFTSNTSGGTIGESTGSAFFVYDSVNDASAYTFTMSDTIVQSNVWDNTEPAATHDGTTMVKGLDPTDKYTATVTDCQFLDNFSDQAGGFYCGRYAEGTVTRCLFKDNVVYSNGGASYKGGQIADCLGETCTYISCAFLNNKAGYESDGTTAGDTGNGGALCTRLYPKIVAKNCSFANNVARSGSGDSFMMFDDAGTFDADEKQSEIYNCLFYGTVGNDKQVAAAEDADKAFDQVINCAYEAGELDIDTDTGPTSSVILTSNPFVNEAEDDFTLDPDSLCINAGTNLFSDGDGDQTDLAGYLIWDDTTDAAAGSAVDGFEIGAYGYQTANIGDMYFDADWAGTESGTQAQPYSSFSDVTFGPLTLQDGDTVYCKGSLGLLDLRGLVDDPTITVTRAPGTKPVLQGVTPHGTPANITIQCY